jgi:uncharacterized protein (TIGR03083 family)
MDGFMAVESIGATALRAESAVLAAVAAGLTEADLERPSPCPPWTAAGLLGHVIVAAGRVGPALEAAPAAGPGAGPLTDARGYYRPDHRFSPAVNADRVDVAAGLAARLRTAPVLAAELAAACQLMLTLAESAPAGTLVRTRHGDLMPLTDFVVTRVVELGVHGLDLAIALDREPWLTSEAAVVLEDLLLPGDSQPAQLQALLHCDRSGLIARLTGRAALTGADQSALAESGVTVLALG